MSTNTSIEWASKTWGPVLGCDKVSLGCAHCYAIRTAHRLGGNPNPKIKAAYQGLTKVTAGGALNWTGLVRCLPERLADPLHWRKPERIFVNSQSDLFHEDVPDEFISAVFGVMAACPQHVFQILTKRPQRMTEWFAWVKQDAGRRYMAPALAEHAACAVQPFNEAGADKLFRAANEMPDAVRFAWPLPNVWLGVSIEDQETANQRVPLLLQVPAAIRFLSCEPLLGPIELWGLPCGELFDVEGAPYYNALRGFSFWGDGDNGHRGPQIHWMIVGGESGPQARPMDIEWARSLRKQCEEANRSNRHTAFFMKQLGAAPVQDVEVPLDVFCEKGPNMGMRQVKIEARPVRLKDKKGGAIDEFPQDLKVREFPRVEVAT